MSVTGEPKFPRADVGASATPGCAGHGAPGSIAESSLAARRFEVLARMAGQLNTHADLASMLAAAMPLVCELLASDCAWVFLHDGEGGFAPAAAHGLPPELERDACAELCWSGCRCQRRALESQSDETVNVARCERLEQLPGRVALDHGSATLRARGCLLGILNVAFADERCFGAEELALLAALGDTLAVAVDRALLVARATADQTSWFRALARNASDLVVVTSADGALHYASPSVERQLGYPPELADGKHGLDFVHPGDIAALETAQARAAARPGKPVPATVRLRHRDGAWRWTEFMVTDLLADTAVRGIVFNGRDITERRAAEEALARRTFYDHLTGLPNRTLLEDRLAAALDGAGHHGHAVALLLLDLDHFNLVNDSLGHAAGDELLVAVARRLRDATPEHDLIARFGGDEFVVLCDPSPGPDAMDATARRLLEAFHKPFEVGEREVVLTVSIGIAGSPIRGASAEHLVRDADTALQSAKRDGRNRLQRFDAALRARAVERLDTEDALRRALECDELVVHYQPEISLETREVVGIEALVAWRHPERGLLSASTFIDIAEDNGLVVPITRLVLRQACAQARRWHDRYTDRHRVPVSVNLSARLLDHPSIVDDVADALDESGLDPGHLWLEITESALMADVDRTIEILVALRSLGTRLVVDDFGTGYSSLVYLRQFPVDVLKIDKSFVAGLEAEAEDLAIVRAVIDLAHALGLTVVAEGVEREEQVELLAELGCTTAQGFYWTPPLLSDSLERWLEEYWS